MSVFETFSAYGAALDKRRADSASQAWEASSAEVFKSAENALTAEAEKASAAIFG
jgi:hypothetical protein